MQCPDCGNLKTYISDTRHQKHTHNTTRRHDCTACNNSFRTIEVVVAAKSVEAPEIPRRYTDLAKRLVPLTLGQLAVVKELLSRFEGLNKAYKD